MADGILLAFVIYNFIPDIYRFFLWEVLMWVDSEAAARVSGAAETVDYFG